MSLILEAKADEASARCAEYAAEHGEDSPDLLMKYGRALFALAKSNSSLVEQKVEEKTLPYENPNVKVLGVNAGMNYDYKEVDDDNEDAAAGNEGDNGGDESKGGVSKGEDDEKDDEKDEKEKDEKEKDEKEKDEKEKDDNEKADNKDDKIEDHIEEEESEDEDDFVRAFSVVDVARVLLEKQLAENDDTQTRSKLIEARELLGDISLEDNNPPQAVEDYLAAVELKRRVYGELSGEVSEAEFVLSLAYDLNDDKPKALEHLKHAVRAAQEQKLPSAAALEQRAQDLEADIGKETEDAVKQAKKVTAEGITGRTALQSAVKSLTSNATDISQLTRKRKRPADESK